MSSPYVVNPRSLQVPYLQQRTLRGSAVKESAEKLVSSKSPYRARIERSFDQENSFTRTHQHHSQDNINVSLSYNSQHNLDSKNYLNQQSRDLLAEIQESQHRLTLSEMEDKLVMFVTENERLQRLLAERERDLHNQMSHQQQTKTLQEEKLRSLETKTTKLIYENEKVVLLNDSLTQEMEQMHKILKMQYQNENELQQQQITTHYEMLLMDQNERFQLELQNQVDALMLTHTEKMRHYTEEMQAGQKEHKVKDSMGQELINQNHALIHQAKQMHINLMQADERLLFLQNQLEELVLEIGQINDIVAMRDNELQQIRIQFDKSLMALDEKGKKENLLQQTIQQFQSQIQQHQQKINKQQEEIMKLNMQLNEMASGVREEHHKQTQITNLVQNEQSRNRSLQTKMEDLLVENQNLNSAFLQRINELESWKQKHATLQLETNLVLEKQVKHFEVKQLEAQTSIKTHFQEIVVQKERELQNLNERINLIINQLDLMCTENRKLKTLYQETLSDNDQLKPRLPALQKEVDRLRLNSSNKEDDCERLRQQIVKLQNNYEIQHQEEHRSVILLQAQFDEQNDELAMLRLQRQELKGNIEETTSNLNQVQALLNETHNKYKHLQQVSQLNHTELVELRQIRVQLGSIKSTQKLELDNLKQQFEQAIKIRVQKEVSLEKERQIKFQILWEADKHNFETQIQQLMNENNILKQDIMLINVNYNQAITDIQQTQNKQLSDVNLAYNLEMKGLTQLQQVQFNSIIQTLQDKMTILSAQNTKRNTNIHILEDKIVSLEREISRLIDEKAGELSKNTQLETRIKRLTPQRNQELKSYDYQFSQQSRVRNPSIDAVTRRHQQYSNIY